MKKIGKNTKLYLIGMIIGGITLGITTVIADTIINSTSVAYKTTTVKAALDELYDIADFKEEVKDMLYPVGSIYISVSSTNPSELFGGTWTAFGQGRTLIGVGTGTDANSTVKTIVANELGGEYTHTLTVAEMPSHNHGGTNHWVVWDPGQGWHQTTNGVAKVSGNYILEESRDWTSDFTGGGAPHNIIQPYISVYMWKRTA